MPNYTVSTILVFTNNGPEYYVGCVKYYNDDMYLYQELTGIHRLYEIDAVDDAKILAKDRFEFV